MTKHNIGWFLLIVGIALGTLLMVGSMLVGDTVSAGDGGDDQVFAGAFGVKVEPIKVELGIVEGQPYQMGPGENARAEVKITNASPATDWAVTVGIEVGPTLSEFYAGPLVTLDAKWDNGMTYNESDVIMLEAGQTRILSIFVEALDGVGTTAVNVIVRHFYGQTGFNAEPTSLHDWN